MNPIKDHIRAIQIIMQEYYGIDAHVEIKGYDVDEEVAKEVTNDAQSVFYGERRDDHNNGTRWSGQENFEDGISVTMYWKKEEL